MRIGTHFIAPFPSGAAGFAQNPDAWPEGIKQKGKVLPMPSLTIAIPTFNRIRWLSLTLPAILRQVKEFPEGEIEIVVSDNCSTDGTWHFLQKTAKQFPFVRLHRNEINIGPEANFYLLPKLATGSYLHMVGDDDIFEEGALTRIWNALQDEPDYVVINFDVYDGLLEKRIRRNQLKLFADETFANQEDCLARTDVLAMGFMSMWVGRREFFNSIPEERYRYFATWGLSIQADRIWGITRFPKGKLIAAPCLRTRHNTDLNENYFFSWLLHGSAEVLRNAAKSGMLSKENIRTQKNLLLRRHALPRIRYERWKGIFKRAETYDMLRVDYGELAVFLFLCVPMMFVPALGKMTSFAHRLLRRPAL